MTNTVQYPALNQAAIVPYLFEPFVDADQVAKFLSMPRREVLKLSREGKLTTYPVSGRIRKTYKYRLSEVGRDVALLRKPSKIIASSPSDSLAKQV
jgi:hypothetical protein